jgi:3',5'-cyclic AMP phosphodiesterase CpdA
MIDKPVWSFEAAILVLILVVSSFNPVVAQPRHVSALDSIELSGLSGKFSFIIASDLGRNGYYDQKPVAEMMGEVAGLTGAEFVAALGDVHHFMGVQSVNDPLWLTDFEYVYSHPELMIPWYPVLGNHEYKGNTEAILDYSGISRRWQMPSRYYSRTFTISDTIKVLMLFIDTSPMIDKYRNDPESEAGKQNMEKQLRWIDSTLSRSDAKWKIVMGHHPIYAGTLKTETEQTDLQSRLLPVLERYKTDMYLCGHIHFFEHLRVPGSDMDFIVNTSGALNRAFVDKEGLVYSSGETGFILCTVENSQIKISLINKSGEIIYRYARGKSPVVKDIQPIAK